MRKSFVIVLILFLSFLVYQVTVIFFTKKHEITYELTIADKSFSINEKYIHIKKEGYYLFELKYKNEVFVFDKSNVFNKRKKVIESLEYYEEEDVFCILPIYIKDESEEIYCSKDGAQYSYTTIKEFINTENLLAKLKQRPIKYENKILDFKLNNDVTYYINNAKRNEYIAIYHYKFLEIYNEAVIDKFNFSEKDIYNNRLGLFHDKYFLMPIYSASELVKGFHVVDISTNVRSYFFFDDEVSNNSYIQGVVNDKVYLLDKSHKKQYKIDLENKKYETIGNIAKDAQKFNGKDFETVNIQSMINNEVIFPKEEPIELNNKKYQELFYDDRAYYLYTDQGEFFKVYKNNLEKSIYLFKENNLKDIIVSNGAIYFLKSDSIYRYDQHGIKIIVKWRELQNNLSNMYGAYYK